MRMSLRDLEKEVGNLFISIPLLGPEIYQLRMSLKLTPSRLGDAKYLKDKSLPMSEVSPYPVHSDFHTYSSHPF